MFFISYEFELCESLESSAFSEECISQGNAGGAERLFVLIVLYVCLDMWVNKRSAGQNVP